jgi:hypothetical protein
MFGPDSTYEVAGGGTLRVKNDQGEKLGEGGGDLVLGGEGIQTKLDCLIKGRAVTLSG